ncbi:MAG: beta-ketoacyl-[acyl-carrier-protein] synthase family protein [Planctomycetes bacterium]|nr:beta-ketoacyl-[acyl-carrier-protein] synthase family protein [Planctomycetota bacterium]
MINTIKKNRIVVTGIGVLTPIGTGIDAFWKSLVGGISGISEITRFNTERYPTKIAGEIRNFDPGKYMSESLADSLCRYSQMGYSAAKMALLDADLGYGNFNSNKVGVSIGIGTETLLFYDEKSAIENSNYNIRTEPPTENRGLSSVVSDLLGSSGPNFVVATACSSGNQAIGIAKEMIKSGQVDMVLTGGVESPIFPLNLAAFCSLRVMSKRNDEPTRASRPFDKERDGFVMGEGTGMLVLESEESAIRRGVRIHAEVAGYGATSDAFHMTMPSKDKVQISRSMLSAIEDADLGITDIDYINAHGTSTPANDSGESRAIKTVFGKSAYDIPISSTKSMTGHLMGAAGAVELVACVLAIRNGRIPPTINLENPAPECDLDYVAQKARDCDVNVAMSNSFGFGGNNSTLVIKKYFNS